MLLAGLAIGMARAAVQWAAAALPAAQGDRAQVLCCPLYEGQQRSSNALPAGQSCLVPSFVKLDVGACGLRHACGRTGGGGCPAPGSASQGHKVHMIHSAALGPTCCCPGAGGAIPPR